MSKLKTTYQKGDEVYILSLNTLATIVSCVVVGEDEYYKVGDSDNVLFSMNDLYMPSRINSKVDLVEELINIDKKNMPEDIEQKMKVRALLAYINDSEVTESFYSKVI